QRRTYRRRGRRRRECFERRARQPRGAQWTRERRRAGRRQQRGDARPRAIAPDVRAAPARIAAGAGTRWTTGADTDRRVSRAFVGGQWHLTQTAWRAEARPNVEGSRRRAPCAGRQARHGRLLAFLET